LIQGEETRQQSLFLAEKPNDLGGRSFIPKELTSWPLIHFLKVREHDEYLRLKNPCPFACRADLPR